MPGALRAAIEANDLQAVRHQITIAGANINEDDCLTYAVSHDLHDISSFLIACGANCNVHDQFGTSPLHYAARLNNISLMHELINAGANVAACDKAGLVPLHLAALYGWHEAVGCLLRAGASAAVSTSLGISPVELSKRAILRRTRGLFTEQTTLGEIVDFHFDAGLMASEHRINDPTVLNIASNPQVRRLQRVIRLLESSARDSRRRSRSGIS